MCATVLGTALISLGSLFSREAASLLGIDVSSSTVKLVEIGRERDGSLVLEHCAIEPLERGWITDGNIEKFDEVADAVRRLVRKSGTRTKNVALALPGAAVITKKITLPAGLSDKELEVQVESEANQYIPFSLNEVSLDFCVIGANPNSPALILALANMNAQQDPKTYENVLNQLYSVFSESPTVQAFYSNFNDLKKQVEDAQLLSPGKMAPDFSELKTDRKKSLKLSDLRGQIVLIDFWASWCGPCRKENPNVVQTYEKYKKDGFTIVSVSLDTDAQKWKNAIEQDQLSWPNHVSDLGGWNSKVAQLYKVSSVPFTVLIDREGHVIKTKLRGPALEEELKRIFGH